MNLRRLHLFHPYLAPAGDAGGEGGSAPDFGNDHLSTDDKAAPAAEVKKPEPTAPAAPAAEADDSKDTLTDDERKGGKYVPRDRLNDVLRKSKDKEGAYQAEIEKLRQQLEANKVDANIEQVDARLAELEDAYDDHMMEGEKAKAKEVRAEIRRLTSARQQMVSYAYSAQAQIAAIEQYRYDNALDQLEAIYPQLDDKSESFDSDVTQEIADLMAVYQQRGMSKAEALKRAASARLGPPPKAKADEKPHSALKEERSTDARKRAMDAVNKQPPDIGKVGDDSDKRGGGPVTGKDLLKMSQEKFAKLDEETLRQLRGDELEDAA